MDIQTEGNRRIVQSPCTEFRADSSPVFNVELGDGEDVEWIWSHYGNGQSLITGYTIIRRAGENSEIH
jgi:hypothetical protein